MSQARRERAAVVGSGIAGLTAAYVLQQRYDVTLYEAACRLGGHTDTHDVVTPDAGTVPIDTGFIVHNQRTYPLLCRLFSELNVATRQTEMSLSVHCDGCGLEYAGAKGLGGVFAQPRSLTNVAFLRLLAQIHRFHRQARSALSRGDDLLSLGEFFELGGYSNYFVSHFVVPIVSCVWSVAPDVAPQYPARYLFVFLENHGMLSFTGSPAWRTVVGGSRTYVDRVVKHLSAVATSTPVTSVVMRDYGAEVRTADDDGNLVRTRRGGHACRHGADPSRQPESETANHPQRIPILAQRHVAAHGHHPPSEVCESPGVLELPLVRCVGPIDNAVVSYDMNRLQGHSSAQSHIVTLNATDRIDPEQVLARMTYEHPIYTGASVEAQRHLYRAQRRQAGLRRRLSRVGVS